MKFKPINRRRFFRAVFYGVPTFALADAFWLEPTWIKIRRVRLTHEKPEHRFVHFTDLHHKGDRAYLVAVVKQINELAPEFVCFTGDIIEDTKYLTEALELFRGIE